MEREKKEEIRVQKIRKHELTENLLTEEKVQRVLSECVDRVAGVHSFEANARPIRNKTLWEAECAGGRINYPVSARICRLLPSAWTLFCSAANFAFAAASFASRTRTSSVAAVAEAIATMVANPTTARILYAILLLFVFVKGSPGDVGNHLKIIQTIKISAQSEL